MGEVFLTTAATIAILMLATWLVSGIVRNASIVDLIWGLGFVLVAWAVFLRHSLETEFDSAASVLVPVLLTTIWGLRLSGYLAWRNIGKGEDFRYRSMRERHGRRFFWVSLGTVFGLQGVLMWTVSLPVQATVARPAPDGLGWLAIVGVAVWVVGIVFETAGDVQLARFKAKAANKGKVMDLGLWRYTRHPNYFGDFCVWWGLYLIALDAGHWWTIVGPAAMTALLMKYSGAGLLEKTIVNRRPGYEDYIRRTNTFFPGPPKA
jgi:steroid 5-alpha reductase family enzyme